jgi:hypothetical protein
MDVCIQKDVSADVPPTIILSCHEPSQLPVQEPLRSTFCFPESTFFFQSQYSILQLKNQWDTFERIENYNSIVLNTLGQEVPKEASSSAMDSVFYQFKSSQEKIDYNLGQLYHTVVYPDITDFQQPYANRPIPYTSTILSTINGQIYVDSPSTVACSNFTPPRPLEQDVLLNNRLGLSIYVRVSTQNSQYPKSPYKFSSNREYITYMNYKKINC